MNGGQDSVQKGGFCGVSMGKSFPNRSAAINSGCNWHDEDGVPVSDGTSSRRGGANGGGCHSDRHCMDRFKPGSEVGRDLAESWNCSGRIDNDRGVMLVTGSKPCMSDGGRMNRYDEPSYRPRRPRYNPDHYYGGNSETKDTVTVQAGGKRKSKKSKKSRRSVEYGSMMLYGGKTKKSKKSKKSRK